MIFSELYSAYYNTVARVLKAAQDHPINKEELRSIIGETAFGESVSVIEPALFGEKWQLIKPDGTTPIKEPPTMPLTLLQKRWLKAIYTDPRVRLFTDDLPDFPGVEPLFTQEDVCVFDKYSDGDPFEDKKYVANFRLILDAIRNKYPLKINVLNRKGDTGYLALMPARLEYSEKDDKFRLIGAGSRYGNVINLGRIVRCRPYNKEFAPYSGKDPKVRRETLVFELTDQRNALERALLHFAHFEKRAEKIGNGKYLISVVYDKEDETEMVIRALSFGPLIKVTAPEGFKNLIKERLLSQKNCGLS